MQPTRSWFQWASSCGGLPGSLAATFTLVTGLAAAAQSPPDPAALLSRHITAVGGEELLRLAGDVEFIGELQTSAGRNHYRVLVRATPFAVRQELMSSDRPPKSTVVISNGLRTWELQIPADMTGAIASVIAAPSTPGVPARGASAMKRLERASALQLLLQPWTARAQARAGVPAVLKDIPLEPDIFAGGQVQSLYVRSGADTDLAGLFSVADGRMLGVYGTEPRLGPAWLLVDHWTRVDGLEWPMRWVSGDGTSLAHVVTLSAVHARQHFDAALFAGDPQPRRTAPEDVAPLRVASTALPGSGYLVVGDARLDAGRPTAAVFDTAADRIYVMETAAAALPRLGTATVAAATGSSTAARCWLDALHLGRATILQQHCFTMAGVMPEFSAGEQPLVVVGAAVLRDDAPIFDLQARRLILRGVPGPPMEAVPSAVARTAPIVLHVPLLPDPDGGPFVFIDIGLGGRTSRVLLDTGMPYDARLSRAALHALGLPETRAPWLARGAVTFESGVGAAHAGETEEVLLDLLVRLDALELPCREGTVVFERPWVLLSALDDAGTPDLLPFEGVLGAGLLLPFARIGLRAADGWLELQPDGASVPRVSGAPGEAAAGTRWVVPPRGEFIGFTMQAPRHATGPGLNTLPLLVRVSPGTAAAAAGLRAGDGVLRVDSLDCHGLAPADLWPRLWPPAGTQVEIEVLRTDGTTLTVRLP